MTWALKHSPRRWQTEAHAEWERNNRRGIAAVVTGGGKTTLALMCIQTFLQTDPGGRVVVVVPTLALLDQWYLALQEDLGIPGDGIATYSGESKPEHPSVVNLIVLNSARQMAAAVGRGSTSLLVVDECHRAASSENVRAIDWPHAASLGLSATPEREYDSWLEDRLVPLLGPVVYRYSYADARTDGVISPFALWNVEVDLLPPEKKEYDKLTQRVNALINLRARGEDVEDRLKRVLLRRARLAADAALRIPVAVRLMDDHRGHRAIVFHEAITSADSLLESLRTRGHRATIYHSGIAAPVRRDNLRLYRAGVFDVLVTCRALDEGVNVPETELAIIASATASTRQRVQRLGRVLRPALGKQSATVYTLFASDVERERLVAEAGSGSGATQITWLKSTVGRA